MREAAVFYSVKKIEIYPKSYMGLIKKQNNEKISDVSNVYTGGGPKIWGGVKIHINCPILESSTAFSASSRRDTCHLILRFL